MTTFEKLRELLVSDDPALLETDLLPDGAYQLETVRVSSLSRRVSDTLRAGFGDRRPEDFPLLVVGWGKCRVGSTALTNMFGIAGLRSYYQPVKTIARHMLVGLPGHAWTLPDDGEALFAKEMAGPYVHYETLFDPVECLLRAGWPADRLHLLILDRDPKASLSSWMNKWEGKIGRTRVLENFVLSSLNYGRMREHARTEGVAHTHFPYEFSRMPERTVSALFERLGLAHRYGPRILSDWGESGDLNSSEAKVIYPVEPAPYIVPGLHGQGERYRYQSRRPDNLTPAEISEAEDADVRAAYRTSVDAACDELGLTEDVRRELLAESVADHSPASL
ncbi:hypothetical protein ACFQ08_02015 [Streptosporangium algeriense]|uniref:Sulfotransferase family protein n=1 Tax=Streptosporangium algeriense TaxID=1682748 RepID=A0ABW3DHI5_9ACTN